MRGVLDSEFPYVSWNTLATLNDVELRQWGNGVPIVVVPGMTGGGQATLQFAVRVAHELTALGKQHRVVLVEFSREAHENLVELQATVRSLLSSELGREPCILWTQSFGNLVAPAPGFDDALVVKRRVMLSPFARLPRFMTWLALVSMLITPAFIYRWAAKPLGRLVFGPAGDQPDHVFYRALAEGEREVARRRTSWLYRQVFDGWFEALNVPTRVFLGQVDHLVNIRKQRAFFERLAREKSQVRFTLVEGAGHVVTDRQTIERVFAQLLQWLTLD